MPPPGDPASPGQTPLLPPAMDPGEQTRDPYPWHLLLRTLLLLNAFLALGINDAIRGPTLLDLR